jgi:3-deoxy-D-manno-octulosonic-acid transferase
MARLAYDLLLLLLLPLLPLRLLWRARRQREYLRHVGERFGRYPIAVERPVIWLHAVSVGETRAAAPLVEALLARHPDHPILLTHMTPTGRATSEALFGDRVLRAYLPYDYPFAARRFLRHFRPRLALFIETELWPNLIAACNEAGVPVWLVNARLSEKSAARYGRFAGLSRELFRGLAGVLAQTEADALRLRALGAQNVAVSGNLKFDITPPDTTMESGRALRARFGARPVLLAASTREGEEALLLDALGECGVPGLLFVIVPRHPQRFDEVAALLERRGLKFQRRSAGEPVAADTRVVLGDSMGEMFAYYAACDLAYVGGSLLPLGGQNLIEACAMGVPVLVGPHTFNFAQATADAIAAGAALRVADAEELMRAAAALLGDAERRARMGTAARAFAAAHRGATERTLLALGPALGARAPTGP